MKKKPRGGEDSSMALQEPKAVAAVVAAPFLIGLSLSSQFELLPQVVDRLYIAPACAKRLWNGAEADMERRNSCKPRLSNGSRCKNRHAVEMMRVFLSPGEAELLVMGEESGCFLVFVDGLRGRRAAQEASFRTVRVPGFVPAKRNWLIQEVQLLLGSLNQQGYRLSQALVEAVLQNAGEVDAGNE